MHLLWPDGLTACHKAPSVTVLATADLDRVTCAHCLATAVRGTRGRADRANHVGLTQKVAPWNPDLVEQGTKWAAVGGRYFRVWSAADRTRHSKPEWNVEEVTFDGEPEGHASLDPARPGERAVIWVGGFFARVPDLDAVRAVIAAEVAPPGRGGAAD